VSIDRTREGQDNGRRYFPRLQRFPPPSGRRDQRRGPLASGISEGRDKRGRDPGGKGGVMIKSQISHGCYPRPNGGGAARDDDGVASTRSEGRAQGNGTRGGAIFEGEYKLSIY